MEEILKTNAVTTTSLKVEDAMSVIQQEKEKRMRECSGAIQEVLQKYGAELRVVHDIQIIFK